MNKYLISFFTIITILVSSCSKPEEEYIPPAMVEEIKPVIDNDDYNDGYYSDNSLYNKNNKPLIELKPDEVLINTLNINLDLDSQEEQILILKKRENPEGKISIAVADYNNVNSSYIRSWMGETSAENIRSFDIHLDDMVGDHNSEIICTGRNSAGLTTMDVFRKSTDNKQLEYKSIFSRTIRGNIDINHFERSKSYLQGLKDGESYTITVTTEQEYTNGNDTGKIFLVISKFYWDFPVRKYVLLEEETVEDELIAEKQLETIVSSDESSFYRYIDGPWQYDDLIIYFDSGSNTATFYSDDIQENYSWINSYKVLSNLLYIRCRNEIINYIENEIYVRIIDINTAQITVRDINSQTRTKEGNDIWSNQYTRMDRNQKEQTIKKIENLINKDSLTKLSGQYISDSGEIIEFYGTDFYMRNSLEEFSGGFAVFKSDVEILSLKIIDENGIVKEERSYSLEYKEERKEEFIERTIVLIPGLLSIYGFNETDTEFFRYSQIETLDIQSVEDNQ